MFNNDCVTCIAPWYSIRIDTNGKYRYCEFSKVSAQSSMVPSAWFSNSNHMTAARTAIQQGTPLDGCAQCYQNENNQFESYRQRRNIQAAIHHGPHFKESTQQSPAWSRITQLQVLNKKPAFVHVSLSNVCNLSCRMCDPKWSSKLANIYKKINILPTSTPTLLDWTTDHQRWQDFSQNLVLNNTDLVCLHFMGGEPLYHDKFYQLLTECVQKSRTDFHITFVSNGTIWRPELIDVLAKFKSVAIEISIENFHSTNNYVRHGSDFNIVKKNIVNMLSCKTDNISVVLRTVPQALSVEHYDTVIDFAIEHDLHIDSNMMFGRLELAVDVLPTDFKQYIINKLSSKYSDFLYQHNEQFKVQNIRNQSHHKAQQAYHIQKIIRQLSQPEPENIEDLRFKFVEYNKKIDQAVGTCFQDQYPTLADFYEKYNKR